MTGNGLRTKLGPHAFVFGTQAGEYQENIQTRGTRSDCSLTATSLDVGADGLAWNREQLRKRLDNVRAMRSERHIPLLLI
jgi:hypothetical protein